MIKYLFVAWNFLLALSVSAQGVAIGSSTGTANTSAILDVSSHQKGILIPRMSTIERDGIKNPAIALLVFNSDIMQFQVNTGTAALPAWQTIVSLANNDGLKSLWQTNGNQNLADSLFIGNTDARAFNIKTNNVLRIYIDSVATRIGIGTNAPRTSLDIAANDALIVPVGTTAQRPVAPVVGMIRFNASTNKLEGYTTIGWVALH